ncbi:hypothetical protein ACIRRA_33760 [Nocardia sp. NPDC101769]|uniref:hypothetical protein n=1 Tax=Nocardia sp. NPDC101769 TaxID=3364333 RepID=UPI003824B1B2
MRAVRLLASVHVIDLPDEIEISVNVSDPQYVLQENRLLVRVTHTVTFYEAKTPDSESTEKNAELATIKVAHVADLKLRGDAPDPGEIDDLFRNNTIFMIHPYARSAIHRLAVEVGLPPVVLPYLRRSDWPPTGSEDL